jgi:hypothetical protein
MTPNFRNSMWFGNRNYMQWIVPPQINYDSSRAGKVYTAQYTNGGAWVRRSATGSRHYNFAWNLKRRDEIRAIMDYADGVYGTDNPIYFIDPFAADKNVLPQYWAVPSLGADDAPQLQGLGDEQRPNKVATGANIIGLPTYTAVYTIDKAQQNPPLYIPIPPNTTLWVGAFGTATGAAGVNMIPATGPTTYGTPVKVPLLGINQAAGFTASLNGNAYPGAFLQINGNTGDSLTLTGVMAQIHPNGITPQAGRFVSGQGHSGCSFNDNPVLSNYSAAIDRVGLTVDLIETEGWQ